MSSGTVSQPDSLTETNRVNSPSSRIAPQIAVCVALILIYFYLSVLFAGNTLDDPWISFRYARNLARGLGFRWNPGEAPVEGFTCFLWVLINSIGIRLHVQPLAWSQFWSFIAGAVELIVVFSPWNILVRSLLWRAFLGMAMATCPLVLFMAGSGMETQFGAVLLVLAVLAWIRGERLGSLPGYLSASVLLTLACMTRPESGLFLVLLPIFTIINIRGSGSFDSAAARRILALTAPAILIGVPYVVFHALYFGHVLPNTYYAKYSGNGLRTLSFGISYVCASVGAYLAAPFAVIVSLLMVARTERLRIQMEIFAACIAFCLCITYAGGDDIQAFPMGRLLIPVILLSYLVLASLLEDALRSPRRNALPAAIALIILIFMQEATEGAIMVRWASNNPFATRRSSVWSSLGKEFVSKLRSFGQDPEAPAFRNQMAAAGPGHLAEWILAHTSKDDYVAFGGIGYISYITDRPIIDMNGLNDSHIAHLRPSGSGIVSKGDPEYVVGRRPKVVVLAASPACYRQGFDYNCLLSRADPATRQYLQLLAAADYQLQTETVPWGRSLDLDLAIFVRRG